MAWVGCWKDVFMSVSRRNFTVEYKIEAARRVIDSGRTIAEVARRKKHFSNRAEVLRH